MAMTIMMCGTVTDHNTELTCKLSIFVFQEKLAMSHGSQCGFCTPGIVMSMYTLLRNNPLPEMNDVESAFEGTYATPSLITF